MYDGVRTYKLQTNYRSTPEILNVANEVISGNPEQFQKELNAVRESGTVPKLVRARDGSAQARYIIECIQNLSREGISPSDCCILYRSHFHEMELHMELAREQIP